MICIACGEAAGFNRAVIDLVSDTELGGLCVSCEREEFGHVLESGRWNGDENCVLCGRDGLYGLPEWRPTVEDHGAVAVCANEYEVSSRTATLCDEHLHAVRDHWVATESERQSIAGRK